MHKEGHVGAALLFYSPLGFIAYVLLGSQLAFLGALVAVGLAMFPDIDMRIPLIKHRGPTHTVWFALIVGLVLAVIGGSGIAEAGFVATIAGSIFGLLVGIGTIISHIAADALTPAGVRPFWPLHRKSYSYRLVRASNPIANYLLLAIGGGAFVVAVLTAQNIA